LQDTASRLLLRNKVNDYIEVEVCLFQYCNMGCKFCFQDNKDKTGLNTISLMQHRVADWIKEEKSGLPLKVSILGGELFQKNLINIFYKYQKFCKDLKFGALDRKIDFCFISNLNFSEDVAFYVENAVLFSSKAFLGTSWDFSDRKVNPYFHTNLLRFKEHINAITFVLTRPSIQKLISGENLDYFTWLTENFEVQWDYYTPNKFADTLMPSDKEIYDALCFLIENYPELPQVQNLLYNKETKTSCLSPNKVTFLPNGEIVACRYAKDEQSKFRTPIDRECNGNIISTYIQEKGCLTCEFYKRCPLSCFVMNDHSLYKEREELDECFFKKIFCKYKPNV